MTAREQSQDLVALDAVLAQSRPFGDSDYIRGQMHAAYARRLQAISASMPIAGDLLDALARTDARSTHRAYGDPVVRCAVQHAATQLGTGQPYGLPLADCEEVLEATLRHLQAGSAGSPLESSVAPLDRLGEGDYHGRVWSDDGSNNVFSRSFRYLVQSNFGDPVGSPNLAALHALRRGVELLEDVLPCVTRSALSHVHVVALFPSTGAWTNMASCSQFRLVGTVFLKRNAIDDPWWLAEHLLHEALHQKLYDLRHGHLLLARDSAEQPSATDEGQKIVSIWNIGDGANSNHWGISRAIVALHVYAHLVFFGRLVDGRAAELEGSYGPRPSTLTDSLTALERALYLADAIRESCWHELGPAGEYLIDWLTEFLAILGPVPPRAAVHLDLTIQRYRREADKVNTLRAMIDLNAAGGGGHTAELREMVKGELATTRQILGELDSDKGSNGLDSAIGAADDEPAWLVFSRTRALIVKAFMESSLLSADPDESSRTGFDNVTAESAMGMMESSSDRLSRIFQELELAPVSMRTNGSNTARTSGDRDERAELLKLTDILGEGYGTDEFCLFLYTIVRMHAPRAIVELGTGHGTTAFWMALAAKRNHVGHVWTVDDHYGIGNTGAVVSRSVSLLEDTLWSGLGGVRADMLFGEISRLLELDESLTFIRRRMHPEVKGHFNDYAFVDEPIDLLFSDFKHGPREILQILGHFLPLMAESSSIFIDSASTSWPSYLLLERLTSQLNGGQVPALLQEQSAVDLAPFIRDRRIVLMHLTEWKRRDQNSTAWLKFEPIDLQPHPRTFVRGLS